MNNTSKSGTADGMREAFKKATTEMLILHLLKTRPMYVYEMIHSLEKQSNGLFTVATLYPAIYRLLKFHYIEEYERTISDNNRLRKYYRITKVGSQYLEKIQYEYEECLRGVGTILMYSNET